MSIFLVLTFVEEGEAGGRTKKFREWPFVSVIVPAFNESATIGRVVNSVLGLDYPKEKLEVIVVDDGSTDGTSSVREIQDNRVKVIRQPRRGKASALNLGLDHARGKYVACLDADSFVSPGALKEMVVNFSSGDIAAVTPVMHVHNPKTVLEKIQNIEYLLAVYMKRLLSHMNAINVTPGPFSIYRADVLRSIGKFDEKSIVEDQEIAYRIQRHNFRIVQSDSGDVYTVAPKNLGDLYRQRKRWYKGSWLTFNKYREMMMDRKYGDFGFYLMPNILFGLVSCFFMLAFFAAYVVIPLADAVRHIYIAGLYVNLGSYLNFADVLANFVFFADFYKLFILWSFTAITTFMIVRSHKSLSRSIGFAEAVPVAAFMLAYYIFISFVNIASTADLMRGGEHRW
ncbi:MAG: glycosyltransferase family 2 protein [Candidatus Aenigmarchaeota archaeon]|nr:glycosyltransferase family 2 protein [Candidatus Aenigmarchaeota archaeon]